MEKKIIKSRGSIFCNEKAWEMQRNLLEELQPSKVFILIDENTQKHCLDYFLQYFKYHVVPNILVIKAGEKHKSITTCLKLWNDLSSMGADRKSLLINLGGGVVTDLGGFVACTYQRGIEFINIPTSLLAMVDASVGGKNGVDLGVLKNQVGIIKEPKAVFVDTQFLKTLPKEQFVSGMAEMIKHGLIYSESYLERILQFDKENTAEVATLVWESIEIKNEVVSKDPLEKNLRKTLNYGHTLGHAIESYYLKTSENKILLHGEAVAIGLILATYISHQTAQFPKEKLNKITQFIVTTFEKVRFSKNDIDEIIKLLVHDKKNVDGKVQFVLLKDIGCPKLNCSVTNELIHEAFKFYAHF